ncbi:MAG: MltA domain-containing protein [Nitrospirae bacterium]|nr:MltA domain-containing protein [Nitrospirota bacterium]
MLIAAMFLSACAGPQAGPEAQAPALVRVSSFDHPDFTDEGDLSSLSASVSQSIAYLEKLPPERAFTFDDTSYTAPKMARSLTALRDFLLTNPAPDALSEYVAEHFDVYESVGSDGYGTVLFTGYYTPELDAHAEPDDVYQYPLYRLPDDLVSVDLGLFREKYKGEKIVGRVEGGSFVPYHTRRDIDNAFALSGRGLEIAWLSDPVEIFFLQVQGSGVLRFPDGGIKHVNYAGANGRAYRSIGKFLVEQGKASLDEMSLDFLKAYLRAHPDEAMDILNYNESYVFFTLADDGPFGSLGLPVTGERSIATDKAVFPPGGLAFIETDLPSFNDAGEVTGLEAYSRFVLDQDTGGAIKGPGRVDIYFGFGEEARRRAGYMKQFGRLYYLVGRGE